MFHDDDCGELLDLDGKCLKCKFYPDTQSTAFKEVSTELLSKQIKNGKTFLGLYRKQIVKESDLYDRHSSLA